MTRISWVESQIGPTTMWVEGRTARDYESQGFKIVDYEPPPEWLRGCWSGRAKITKPGSECVHVWSPELAALHKRVCDAHSEVYDGLRPGKVWHSLGESHDKLFRDCQYHEKLIFVKPYSDVALEEPQGRIVAAILEIAEQYSGEARKRLLRWAAMISDFKYLSTAATGP